MELDRLKYLPVLTPEECKNAPVYEMAKIGFKAVIASDTFYTDVLQVLGRGEVFAGIIQPYKVAEVLYARRVNLGVNVEGDIIRYEIPVESHHRIQLEDIVEYVVLQPKLR
ncbi:MAG: hypothetical protein Q7K45_04020 [Nanoarchaeota archaeon]|nr:hypothetical protein [Nanoarchaeota archaeon]